MILCAKEIRKMFCVNRFSSAEVIPIINIQGTFQRWKRRCKDQSLAMSIFQPNTFWTSMWPIRAMIRITPMSNLKVKFVWRILNALMLSFFTLCTYVYQNSLEKSIMSDYLPILVFLMDRVTILTIVSVWTWELKGADLVEKIIVEISEIDEEFKRFGVELMYRKFMFGQLITILLFVSFSFFATDIRLIISLFNDALVTKWSSIVAGLRYSQTIFVVIYLLVLMSVLEALFVRFKLVNQILENIGKSDEKNKKYTFITPRSRNFCVTNVLEDRTKHLSSHILMDKVDRACRIHRRLTKMTNDLSNTFSLYLLAGIICDLIQLLEDRANFALVMNFRDKNYLNFISTFLKSSFCVSRLWYIIRKCSKVCDEANKIGSSLFQVPTCDPVVHEQLQRHSIHFIQTRLRFSVAGIFTMDRALASTILYNSAQLAVVLIRFKDAEPAA